MFALAVVVACSGSQGELDLGGEGGVGDGAAPVLDAGRFDVTIVSTPDTGTTPRIDTGVATPDTGRGATPDTGSGSTPDTGSTGTPDTGIVTTKDGSGGGGVCVSSCTTNTECQSSCPAIAGALNCCDAVTMACFQSAATACPGETMVEDGGHGMMGHDGGGY